MSYNIGDYNKVERNTGDCNEGDYNTGDCNEGDCNAGDCNEGYYNTGDCNTGYRNAGDHNKGTRNTGDYNTGYCNAGDYNKGEFNTGYCNTISPDECLIFNKKGSRKEWLTTKKPNWMYIQLTKWINKSEMTDKEKEAHPSYVTKGGYLKYYRSPKEAYIEAWENTTQEDRELTLKLPNFDDEVFKEIFGFSAINALQKNKTIIIDDKKIEISKKCYEALKKHFKGE